MNASTVCSAPRSSLSVSHNKTVTELHDSRGIVALLHQHPQEEGSLLIGLCGGWDDDVGTRWEGAAKNNLPPCDVLGAVEDWAARAQVLAGQVRILRMSLERQHTLMYASGFLHHSVYVQSELVLD